MIFLALAVLILMFVCGVLVANQFRQEAVIAHIDRMYHELLDDVEFLKEELWEVSLNETHD